jgi:ribosome-binding ATPase
MSLSVGIVGLPNAGKSTLFNALASRRLAETAPRPFTTIDPHEAVVPVPDEKLDKLFNLVKSEISSSPAHIESGGSAPHNDIIKVPATVTFIDIAGLVKGAHQGEGLGNQFLAKIREVDAIVHVVRAFYDPAVSHENLRFEMGSLQQIMEDIETVNIELELGGMEYTPTLIVLNVGEKDLSSVDTREKIIAVTEKFKTDTLAISARTEEELIDFSEKDRTSYLKQADVEETGLEKLVNNAYIMLDLITFYTIKGGLEIHAWSIKRGSIALEAAEKVHTDFAKKFIKAEVINVDELLAFGNWKSAKEKGGIRLEGKDYKLQSEDVIEFKVGS